MSKRKLRADRSVARFFRARVHFFRTINGLGDGPVFVPAFGRGSLFGIHGVNIEIIFNFEMPNLELLSFKQVWRRLVGLVCALAASVAPVTPTASSPPRKRRLLRSLRRSNSVALCIIGARNLRMNLRIANLNDLSSRFAKVKSKPAIFFIGRRVSNFNITNTPASGHFYKLVTSVTSFKSVSNNIIFTIAVRVDLNHKS